MLVLVQNLEFIVLSCLVLKMVGLITGGTVAQVHLEPGLLRCNLWLLRQKHAANLPFI